MSLNPLPLIKGGLSAAGAFLGGIQTYLIVGVVAAVVGASGGAYVGWRWEHSNYLALMLRDAEGQAIAVQAASDNRRRQDAADLAAAVAEATAQGDLKEKVIIIRKEIPAHVTPHQDAVVCVPVGLVRLLDAAVLQTDPGAIQLAAGQSDDACSDVKASVLADAVVIWLSVGHANAEQLNALEAWVVENHKAQVTP